MEAHTLSDFVTHYYVGGRRPFLNLSDLADEELREVLRDLKREREAKRNHRLFGQTYMRMRRTTEQSLRDLFVAMGGKPERRAPHYFVLGESAWFAGLSPDMQSIRMAIADLPPEQTTVTYPDSFTALGVGVAFGLPHEPKPYHGRLYRLDDLPGLVSAYGLPDSEPDADYDGYERRPFEKYIEVQLWSDEPVRAHLPA